MLPQDLHIHSTWSNGDSAVVPEQTVDLIARLRHARVAGSSDHLELVGERCFEAYSREVRAAGLKVGTEINNRYVWRCDWRSFYGPFVDRFDFVIGSDAHQPNWLSQTVARQVAAELGVRERLLFPI